MYFGKELRVFYNVVEEFRVSAQFAILVGMNRISSLLYFEHPIIPAISIMPHSFSEELS